MSTMFYSGTLFVKWTLNLTRQFISCLISSFELCYTNNLFLCMFLTEMRQLKTRPTARSATQQPTAPPPTSKVTASDMFLPYQQISTRPTYGSSVRKRFCAQGMFFYNVKLRDGWNAGSFYKWHAWAA